MIIRVNVYVCIQVYFPEIEAASESKNGELFFLFLAKPFTLIENRLLAVQSGEGKGVGGLAAKGKRELQATTMFCM